MQALKLTPNSSINWLRQGFRLYLKNSPQLSFAIFFYVMCLLMSGTIPLLGVILPSLLMPVLLVGVMNVCKAQDTQQKLSKPAPTLKIFWQFQAPELYRLAALGAVNFFALLLMLRLASTLDHGTLWSVATGSTPMTEAMLQQPEFINALLLASLLSIPLMLASWYAPLLISWHKIPVFRAIVYSIIACWRNKLVFVVYFLCILVLIFMIPSFLQLTFVVMGLGSIANLVGIIHLCFIIFMLPTLFASIYYSFSTVFVPTPDQNSDQNQDKNQDTLYS